MPHLRAAFPGFGVGKIGAAGHEQIVSGDSGKGTREACRVGNRGKPRPGEIIFREGDAGHEGEKAKRQAHHSFNPLGRPRISRRITAWRVFSGSDRIAVMALFFRADFW